MFATVLVERVLGRRPWKMMPRRIQNEHEEAKMSTRRSKMSPRRPQEVKNEPWEAENEPQEARFLRFLASGWKCSRLEMLENESWRFDFCDFWHLALKC